MVKKIMANLRKISMFLGLGGLTLTLLAAILTGLSFGPFTAVMVFFIMGACVLGGWMALISIAQRLEAKDAEIAAAADVQRNLDAIESKLNIAPEKPAPAAAQPAPAKVQPAPVQFTPEPVQFTPVPAQPAPAPAQPEPANTAVVKEAVKPEEMEITFTDDTARFLEAIHNMQTVSEIERAFTEKYGSLPHSSVKKTMHDLALAKNAESMFDNMAQRVLDKLDVFFMENPQLFAEDKSGKTIHCPSCLMVQNANTTICTCCGARIMSDEEAEKIDRAAFLEEIEKLGTAAEITMAFINKYAKSCTEDIAIMVHELRTIKYTEEVYGNMKAAALEMLKAFCKNDMQFCTPVRDDQMLTCPICGARQMLSNKRCTGCGTLFRPETAMDLPLLPQLKLFLEDAKSMDSAAQVLEELKMQFSHLNNDSLKELCYMLETLVVYERTYGPSKASVTRYLTGFLDHGGIIYALSDDPAEQEFCPVCGRNLMGNTYYCRHCNALLMTEKNRKKAHEQ